MVVMQFCTAVVLAFGVIITLWALWAALIITLHLFVLLRAYSLRIFLTESLIHQYRKNQKQIDDILRERGDLK